MLQTIIQTIESYQSLDSWAPENSTESTPRQMGPFFHFINEWCCHLERSSEVKTQIFEGWHQGRKTWQEETMASSSPFLFSLGRSEAWKHHWKTLQDLPHQDDLPQVCDTILDWAQNQLLEQPSILQGLEKEPLSHPSVRRRVLGVLPYPSGVLSLVLVKFSPFCLTPPHRHTECLAETVLSGNLIELQFKSTDQGLYKYSGYQQLNTGEKTISQSEEGHPHMIFANSADVVTLAVFAGKVPIQYFDPSQVANQDEFQTLISRFKKQQPL